MKIFKMASRIAAVLSLLLSGCFFGTFQTAQTLEPGGVDAGWYVNYPFYFDKVSREEAKNRGKAYTLPNIGGYIGYGTNGSFDVGLRGSLGEGIGPYGKLRLLNESPFSLGTLFGFGYHPVAQGISLHLDLLVSKRLSRFSSIYTGLEILRMPDYRRGTDAPDIQDVDEFKQFEAIFFGIKASRKGGGRYRNLPFGITLEFTFPLTENPALIFGVQFER